MSNTASEFSLFSETNILRGRARAYILTRLAFDLILLPFAIVAIPAEGLFPPLFIILADIFGLIVYWFAVRRWPTSATYLQIIYATLLLITLDFSLGEIAFVPWLFLIPLSMAGGLIVTRPGFNSFVTLSILTIFGAYVLLVFSDRIFLPQALPRNIMLELVVSLGIVLLLLNALVESLVIYLYQNQEALTRSQVQYLQAQRELDNSNRQLADIQRQTRRVERLSTVGQIAGQISTSLRTPLEDANETLNQPYDLVCQPENILRLDNDIRSALRMTEGLQDFASLGRLHVETVNLDDLLAEELAKMQVPAGISLNIQQPPVFPPIQGDPKQLRLVIHHLLDNTLQAVRKGGVVKVDLEPSPEGVRFSVSDSGYGIPAEQLALIFEPLYTTQQNGFGLGLAICQQVVQLHGGQIKVDSAVDEGSTFTVTLPRVPRQLPEELAQDAAG